MKRQQTTTLAWDDIELRVTYDYWPAVQAQVSGPPERCYPAEDAEVDITHIDIRPYGYRFWLPTVMAAWGNVRFKAIEAAMLDAAAQDWQERMADAPEDGR